MEKLSFERALSSLEDIVKKLENGLPLEESYKVFAEGIKLSKYCENILGKTEKRVEVLLKAPDGNKI